MRCHIHIYRSSPVFCILICAMTACNAEDIMYVPAHKTACGDRQVVYKHALLAEVEREWEVGSRLAFLAEADGSLPGFMGTGLRLLLHLMSTGIWHHLMLTCCLPPSATTGRVLCMRVCWLMGLSCSSTFWVLCCQLCQQNTYLQVQLCVIPPRNSGA